jgi:hypothetical protein
VDGMALTGGTMASLALRWPAAIAASEPSWVRRDEVIAPL